MRPISAFTIEVCHDPVPNTTTRSSVGRDSLRFPENGLLGPTVRLGPVHLLAEAAHEKNAW